MEDGLNNRVIPPDNAPPNILNPGEAEEALLTILSSVTQLHLQITRITLELKKLQASRPGTIADNSDISN